MIRKFGWLLVLAACTKDDTDVEGTPGEPVTFATYNGGLAIGFVDGAESRTPQVAAAVAELDADVVCLQEIWTPEQIDAVLTASATNFPHQYNPDAMPSEPGGDPACPDGELDEFMTCIADNCADSCDDELVDCVFANCPVEFLTLEKTCQGCVMANVGGEVQVVADECEAGNAEWAYGGSFGTILLSKLPIAEVEHHVFESTTNRRGVIHATVEGPDNNIDVYCTHLTAVFDVIPYPREEGSWLEEQAVQISELTDLASEPYTVVLGDVNTGPAIGADIVAEVSENYQLFVDAGWSDAYTEGEPTCTFCGDNPLVGGGDSVLIDHIFTTVPGSWEASAPTRLFDQTIDAETCDETFTAALSDHYGVSVTLAPVLFEE